MNGLRLNGRRYATFSRRFLALLVDGPILVVLFIVGIHVINAIENLSPAWVGPVVLFLILLFYEPVLVSMAGGTVGHYALNLRVIRADHDQNIGFIRAFLRTCLKGMLGLVSFIFMYLTRRHQALHDKAVGSAVIVHDLTKAKPTHYMAERETPAYPLTPWWKRALIIVLYVMAIYIAMFLISWPFISNACVLYDQCTDGEDLIFAVSGFLVIAGWGIAVVLGWQGRLPGARNQVSRSTSETNGV